MEDTSVTLLSANGNKPTVSTSKNQTTYLSPQAKYLLISIQLSLDIPHIVTEHLTVAVKKMSYHHVLIF